MKLINLAKKECSFYLEGTCFDTGKPCHIEKNRCEKFEAWIIPLGKRYRKEIKNYVEKTISEKTKKELY